MPKSLTIFLALSVTWACKSSSQSSSKEAWDISHDPGPLAVDPSNLAHLDTSIEDNGAVYNPDLLKQYYRRQFNQLPLNGQLDAEPWASTYWPSMEGGIAAEWNKADSSASKIKEQRKRLAEFRIYNESEVRKMAPRDIASLSPAHKYEIYIGDFTFPSVTWERQRTSIAGEEWEGLCDGWASAAINFRAPKAIILKGQSGIDVPFGASDIEALLTYYQSKIYRDNKKSRSLATTWRKVAAGGRCREDLEKGADKVTQSECKGINAGSFHIILANRIGLNKLGVVIDITPGKEVWNQPLFSYRSQVLRDHRDIYATAAPGTAKIVELETEIKYTQESDPHWQSLGGKNSEYLITKVYRYTVELDKNDEIIGGEWLSPDRPDYMAHRLKPPSFDGAIGHWHAIGEIYEKSLRSDREPANPAE